MTHTPERLNLWDRLFNRYRREVAARGTDHRGLYHGGRDTGVKRSYHWVEYKVIDRLTGSETIEREYMTQPSYDPYA